MDQNPYAAPKTDGSGAPSQPAAPLSPELETRAVEALGKLRARGGVRSFAVIWAIGAPLLVLFGLGFVPAFIVGAVAAGALSKVYVRSRKDAYIDAVCADLGISRSAFNPDRYLID